MNQHLTITTLLLILFSSCVSQQNIQWKTGTTAATIQLPDDAKTMVVLNRVRLSYPFSGTDISANTPEFMRSCLNSFKNQIRRQQFLSASSTRENYTINANGAFPDTLTLSEVKSIGMGSDVVASLEMLDQKTRDSYAVEIRRENLGNNVYREIDYFIGKRTIDVKVGWRLYQTSSGIIIDEWEQSKSYTYEAESTVRTRATSLLNLNYKKELSNLGVTFGRQYAQRISPTQHFISRSIYTSSNAYLENGARAALQEKWDEAEEIWLEGTVQETKRKKRAYLYHNLAINEERKGDINKAREYAKLAANQHPVGVKTQSIVGF